MEELPPESILLVRRFAVGLRVDFLDSRGEPALEMLLLRPPGLDKAPELAFDVVFDDNEEIDCVMARGLGSVLEETTASLSLAEVVLLRGGLLRATCCKPETAALPLALPNDSGLDAALPKLVCLGLAVVGVTAVVASVLEGAGRMAEPRTVAWDEVSWGLVVEEVEAEVIELEAACFPIVLFLCNRLSEGRVGKGGGTARGGMVECLV